MKSQTSANSCLWRSRIALDTAPLVAAPAAEFEELPPPSLPSFLECLYDIEPGREEFCVELVRKPSSVATCRELMELRSIRWFARGKFTFANVNFPLAVNRRARSPKPDEGVACATPRRDESFAAENIGVLAEYGVSGQALVFKSNLCPFLTL